MYVDDVSHATSSQECERITVAGAAGKGSRLWTPALLVCLPINFSILAQRCN